MNIKEVAKHAGVSVATVSRVLNHPDSVADKTKEKISAVMEELGYQPNWFARGLNLNKTHTIGLFVPDILDPSYMEIAKGVEDIAHQRQYTALLCHTENDLEKERNYVKTLLERKIDGFVLISTLLLDGDIQAIIEQNVPVVLIGQHKTNCKVPVVQIGCKLGAKKAVEHLVEMGRSNIACLYGRTPKEENAQKTEGYQEVLADAKLEQQPQLLAEVENSIFGGYVGARRFMAGDVVPDAIFVSSDVMAVGVLDALRGMGIAVPEDVAVVGFDNIRMSSLVEPKLTTVEKPLHNMGLSGMRLLVDAMECTEELENPLQQITFEPKLIVRKSSGNTERILEIFHR
ncbi:LacI family DNA-binding transcriptional regulator [Chakrabartyella piscis]|uniref:LacI family DNA-binding transcriptional regulator n=1 Tax=Chakrabartyella piscis TaxID=2918914 RepID=UPI0029587FBF|nr:LacI family DNA-binding transcriptional regulator [Chakrabartyella piscis]